MNWNTNNGDLGHWWRSQAERSLEDLDRLAQYKLHFGNKLGADKVAEIESDVNLFADADQFRIYHAKGRWRGTWSAMFSTMAITTVLNGGRDGRTFMRKQPLIAGGIFLGSWVFFYQFWSRYCGYTAQKYNEF